MALGYSRVFFHLQKNLSKQLIFSQNTGIIGRNKKRLGEKKRE